MSEERVLKVTADAEKLYEVQDFVNALLEENDCPMKTQMQIEIALEEMFVNIAHYAYPDGGGWAEVHAAVKDGAVSITLVDGGVPFDPLAKPDPDVTHNAEQREIGGLGIYMVKKSMDGMTYEYRDGHNVVTFRKKL